MNNYFTGRKVVIATMHGKEKVIGPLLAKHFGAETFVPSNFNTDVCGTFTREINRHGDQKEAARKKAEMAMDISSLDLAIASEGSFYPHPSMPFLSSNAELILLVDKKNGIEVEGFASSLETNHDQEEVSSLEEVISFVKKIGFPEHGIIVRKSKSGGKIEKEIKSMEELEEKAKKLLGGLFVKSIYLETDMRAHRNPTRMKVIGEAVVDLIKNIESACPSCGMIGFCKSVLGHNLTCRTCSRVTDIPGSFFYSCQRCDHKEERCERDFAKEEECAYCNP